MKICEKQSKKKVKVFGESAARLKAREKAEVEEAKLGMDKRREDAKKLVKQQSQQFQSAMKNASAIAKGDAPTEPELPVEDTRTPCPHCGRKFEEAVAERHIPKCAQTKAKPNAVGTAMKRPGGSKGGAKPTGATTPPRADKAEPPPPAEPKLNPRQILEAKKAAEKAAEAPPVKKKPAGGSRKATPTKVR